MIYFKILFIILLTLPVIGAAAYLYYAIRENIRKLNFRDRKKQAVEQAARAQAQEEVLSAHRFGQTDVRSTTRRRPR
ncbi:MAG: hypothetical protein E7220_03630 [Clostridiales bacterium]|nr:hypothetical protein [Clostridiales bacterium]